VTVSVAVIVPPTEKETISFWLTEREMVSVAPSLVNWSKVVALSEVERMEMTLPTEEARPAAIVEKKDQNNSREPKYLVRSVPVFSRRVAQSYKPTLQFESCS
jgi:hypothetical protein